ncbi:hypothetical protein SNE35_17940 [Paucibacter sp. R3-3]|uniref:Uncharacterized protein n=1 Tax=Roseateles agri TaxID=3098619 RepID=A0ABU5DMA6_9BURK|nr:hypothetical protein [Paucibacter sp. R3-3]MDY0746399.1 hypothetical protein [Paucibacter sp. R3-3]
MATVQDWVMALGLEMVPGLVREQGWAKAQGSGRARDWVSVPDSALAKGWEPAQDWVRDSATERKSVRELAMGSGSAKEPVRV